MSLLDDLKDKAEASFDNVKNDIYGYFKTRVTTAVVKVGEAPKGNQTAADIAAGRYGNGDGVSPSNMPASGLMNASGGFGRLAAANMIPLVLVAVAAGALLFGKRSRG